MTPLEQYNKLLKSGHFTHDIAQECAIVTLDQIWQEIVLADQKSKRFFGKFSKKTYPHGLYMWGGVGRGKTWLMDSFYNLLPIQKKMRMHFHHFMQYVHQQLNLSKGQQNPLELLAKNIHKDYLVICFDEFFVSNVTDAMILSDLFQYLFKLGTTLVATSNIAPDGLYKDGIHRDRFLPTIELVKQNCRILNVDAGVDYRLRLLKQAQLYKAPISDESDRWLTQQFLLLTQDQSICNDCIEVNHRKVKTLSYTNEILWCEFDVLCREPRSPSDFIEIANRFNTVLVSNVPHLTDQVNDITRRFIYLIDELYDRKVKLIMTSADSILELYEGERLAFEIERTRSRLLEMQSAEYLDLTHRKI